MNQNEFKALIRQLEIEVHQGNVEAGWWTDKDTGADLLETRNRPEMLMLFVSEVSEADEGYVGGLKDDKLPHIPMLYVEIGDVAIRTLDTIGAENRRYGDLIDFDYYKEILQISEKLARQFSYISHERIMLTIVNYCSSAMEHLRKGRIFEYRTGLHLVLTSCFLAAAYYDFDIFDVIKQKREYNAVRPDHKLENRRKEGGKAF